MRRRNHDMIDAFLFHTAIAHCLQHAPSLFHSSRDPSCPGVLVDLVVWLGLVIVDVDDGDCDDDGGDGVGDHDADDDGDDGIDNGDDDGLLSIGSVLPSTTE